MFLIFENLDFGDLLSMAQINGKFSTLAANVFRRKYSQLELVVGIVFEYPDKMNELLNGTGAKIDVNIIKRINSDLLHLRNEKPKISDDKNYIHVNDYGSILKTFMHFGHEIKKLLIQYQANSSWQTEWFGYLINAYSSESLTDIDSGVFEELFKHTTKPLIKVENVRFSGNIAELPPSTIGFCDLFPAVRRLLLASLSDRDFAYINCHMPHLEHVYLERFHDSEAVPDFIAKNPQIRSIELSGNAPKFLQEMNTLLPQLETLKLERFSLHNGRIQFENVNTFDAGSGSLTSPANLHFPRLQRFRTGDVSKRFAEYLIFLNQHKRLSQLHFDGLYMDDSQFQRLTENLNDLTEVTLEYESHPHGIQQLSRNAIAAFLRSHDKVKRLNVINFPAEWKDELQEQLKHVWNTKTIDNDRLSFERK